MKTARLFILSAVVLFCVIPVFSQQTAPASKTDQWSEYYYVNIPVEKVYSHRLGYVLSYRTFGANMERTYIPMEWFQEAGGKASLIRIKGGTNWPYLTVYYKGGAFDHLLLHVRAEDGHLSWGVFPSTLQVDDQFNVKEPILKF